MALKQFKTESKRILDLMINSIYTHKEIFLRELISNASDAIDKLYYKSLNEGLSGLSREDFEINISIDKENRTITVKDNGIGMSREDLENNLGVIAKSGSLNFKKENDSNEEIDIIGQFGVGFYSSFMVADNVTVTSKCFGLDTAHCWSSHGVEGYSIEECEKGECGTTIVLHIKENTDDENYDEFIDQYKIQGLVKKYSDYIRYPIKMTMDRVRVKEGTQGENQEYEHYDEISTLNSMVPIWKKAKNELEENEYNNFYKEKFMDWQDPIKVIKTSTEGTATYTALLFIPSKPAADYYTKNYEKGLQLFASGVMITEKCAELLPDYFSFVKGLVDSQDLSLNISREMLQHDRQLKFISSRLEKKIASELKSMLLNDREKYEDFFKSFGMQLKFGMYDGYGQNKDALKDLVLFYSTNEKKLVTLSEYVKNMKADQDSIYYVSGENVDRLCAMPQTEAVTAKGYEVLLLTDSVDEFAIKILSEYEGKTFKNISSEELNLETEEEKKETEQKIKDNKDLLDFLSENLKDKVSEVKISTKLVSHPVCLSSKGDISIEMEKVLNSMPGAEQHIKAEKVLELNPTHEIFSTLNALYENDKEKLSLYADLLYTQAMMIEGLEILDPVDFSNKICKLMAEKN